MKHIKLFEQFINEEREDVGKYNTVKKAMKAIRKEYGPTPTVQSVASFINDNYYDVTEVERGGDDPRANDKIADLIASYKFDIEEWEIAWADAQNESAVTEGTLKISGAAYDLWDEKEVQRKLRDVKIKIIGDIGGVATIKGNDEELQKVKDILGLDESFVNEYSTIVETKKMIKALKKAIKAADSFDAIGTELDDLDYREKYQWELVEDDSRFSSNNYDGKYPVYVITYLAGSRHAIADPKFWKNSAEIEEQVGDVAIGWITGK